MGFNQKDYIIEYKKTHYKAFKVDLKVEELKELEALLKEKKITKAEFLRNSIKQLKK